MSRTICQDVTKEQVFRNNRKTTTRGNPNAQHFVEALEFLYLTPPTQQTQQQTQPSTQQHTMSNQPSTSNAATIAATLRPVELKLGQPLAFDGDVVKARTWLNNVQV